MNPRLVEGCPPDAKCPTCDLARRLRALDTTSYVHVSCASHSAVIMNRRES